MGTYNLFTSTPALAAASDYDAVNLGTEFYTTAPAWLTELRYLHPSSDSLPTQRSISLYTTMDGLTGTLVAGPFTLPAPSAGGWYTHVLDAVLELEIGTRYRVVTFHPDGRYAATAGYFATGEGSADQIRGPLVLPSKANALAQKQGSYGYTATPSFPTNEFNGGLYWSDVTVTDVDPAPPPITPAAVVVTAALTFKWAGVTSPSQWETNLSTRWETHMTAVTLQRETTEFVPVEIKANGTVTTTGISFSVTPYGSRPTVFTAATILGGKTGALVTGLGPGTYEVYAKITASPETPVIHAGTINIL